MSEMTTGDHHSIHFADYIVFGITTVISLSIGVYYAFSGGKQQTTSEYFLAGSRMTFLPVGISLLVSFKSSVMMLGIPAEMYLYGIQYWIRYLGYFTALFVSIYTVVPLVHPLKMTSAFEYLELRYKSRIVRTAGILMAMVSLLWYMGVVVFGTAIALESVIGIPQEGAIFLVSMAAVIYTSLGGIKAVVWADVFQGIITLVGMCAMLIKGTLDAGGATAVWETAACTGRLQFFNFDVDPTVRHTFWNLFIGSAVEGLGMPFSQATVQRISSCKTLKESKRMMMFLAPMFVISSTLALFQGLVAFGYYTHRRCDPLSGKIIKNPNQIMPNFAIDIFWRYPGMLGLFVAAIISASLSTISTCLSSLSVFIWRDIFHILFPNVSDFKGTVIAKISVVLFGLAACGISFTITHIGGPLTQISSSLSSSFAGPLNGFYLLGALFPWANAKGALSGGFVSFVLIAWLSLGSNFSNARKRTPWLPLAPTDQCPHDNKTHVYTSDVNETFSTLSPVHRLNYTSAVITDSPELEGVEAMYTLSYRWFPVVAILTVFLVGSLVSIITGSNKQEKVDPKYLIPVCDLFHSCLPGRVRGWLISRKNYNTPKRNTENLDISDCKMELSRMNAENRGKQTLDLYVNDVSEEYQGGNTKTSFSDGLLEAKYQL